MIRKVALASFVVFVAWAILDFVIHGLLLGSTYATQPELFRPLDEMRTGLLYFVVAVTAVVFCWIYATLVSPKSVGAGLRFGALWGIAVGTGMGYGTYAVMPIHYHLALGWFLGTVVEAVVAGVLVGAIVKANGSG